jgi:uncharacterized iron-regulated membrane protein
MKILSPQLVKSSLSSHSWIGLMLGGLMYIICLSGTITIFYEEVERWEQPAAEEASAFDPVVVEESFNRYMSSSDTELTEHMYIVFPNDALPRVKFSSDLEGHYLNADGSEGPRANDELSELLTGLHVNLHLPLTLGAVIVSATGALLCGLIISGFLAHPSIIKDAFKLRGGSAGRIGQVDLHNRLSVWGAPFHLMIAITGAYYGLALLMGGLFAAAIDGATPETITAEVFPAEPALENQAPVYAVARALEQVHELSPDGQLLYLIVHDAPTDERFMEIYVQQPGLLAWSENYRFDTAGNYLDTAGYTEGGARQALYSVYRIHFGHFGGFLTKLLYVAFGLALSVVSATGINIWLEKRKYRDALNTIWPGVVWGTPLVLTLASFTQVVFAMPSASVFWIGLALAMTAGVCATSVACRPRRLLRSYCSCWAMSSR